MKKYHPILLPESAKHYDLNGQNNIIEFEKDATIEMAYGAILYNKIKYKNREKGQNDLDDKKMATFESWEYLLDDLLEMGYKKEMNLRFCMAAEFPDMVYSLSETIDV